MASGTFVFFTRGEKKTQGDSRPTWIHDEELNVLKTGRHMNKRSGDK